MRDEEPAEARVVHVERKAGIVLSRRRLLPLLLGHLQPAYVVPADGTARRVAITQQEQLQPRPVGCPLRALFRLLLFAPPPLALGLFLLALHLRLVPLAPRLSPLPPARLSRRLLLPTRIPEVVVAEGSLAAKAVGEEGVLQRPSALVAPRPRVAPIGLLRLLGLPALAPLVRHLPLLNTPHALLALSTAALALGVERVKRGLAPELRQRRQAILPPPARRGRRLLEGPFLLAARVGRGGQQGRVILLAQLHLCEVALGHLRGGDTGGGGLPSAHVDGAPIQQSCGVTD
eukprot:scaffold5498_cov102-Isochrysis_galbana.AAC.1